MTRDEAIAIYLRSPYQKGCSEWRVAGEFIDKFVALGMLKLDEPSVRTKALDALFEKFGAHDIETMLELLDDGGLKVVEK